jgi:cytochrome c553
MKKRDILVLLGGLIILAVLWMAPAETTTHVPKDETHLKFYDMVQKEGKAGKKHAEEFCQNCHNQDQVQFPADHPPKLRCLFCHKI